MILSPMLKARSKDTHATSAYMMQLPCVHVPEIDVTGKRMFCKASFGNIVRGHVYCNLLKIIRLFRMLDACCLVHSYLHYLIQARCVNQLVDDRVCKVGCLPLLRHDLCHRCSHMAAGLEVFKKLFSVQVLLTCSHHIFFVKKQTYEPCSFQPVKKYCKY